MTPYRLGLTGSIGMGKTTTAGFFARAGVPVWEADEVVRRLYAPGGAAVEAIAGLRPDARQHGAIDREVLKSWIGQDPAALRQIETVVHPLVASDRLRFIEACRSDIVVLDIPLLFETGAEDALDATLVVTAPPHLQRRRVMVRPGMTEAHFEAILANQMPDREKRARATHIIETLGLEAVDACVQALLTYIRSFPHA